MKRYLVGHTGFVGSNIAAVTKFDGVFNSKNIGDAYGGKPDLLIYAGVPAEKFFANKNPEKDLDIISTAAENIARINPRKLVLISTVDVYKNPNGVDEETPIDTFELCPYGANRYHLEQEARNIVKETYIIRLPALFGKNLKKNFVYDLIHIIPTVLTEQKLEYVTEKCESIKAFYINQNNGFYKCRALNRDEYNTLRHSLLEAGFSALDFTDSRAVFQFYNLLYLWGHINTVLDTGIHLVNIATEPIKAADIYKTVRGGEFVNEFMENVSSYDVRTKYTKELGGDKGYIFGKQRILSELKAFVDSEDKR